MTVSLYFARHIRGFPLRPDGVHDLSQEGGAKEEEHRWWTAKRKVELLLQWITGEATLMDACRSHDLAQTEVEGWMDTFLKVRRARAEGALGAEIHDR